MGRFWSWGLIAFALMLGGCSKSVEPPPSTEELAEAPASQEKGGDAIQVSVPQIAYTYHYSFRLPADAIVRAQDRHLAMCDRLGPARCRVLAMGRASGDDGGASGSMTLAVEAGIARNFGVALGQAVASAGGRQGDASIEAEDLSKRIVDTEARVRARQALADRLMALLQTRNGPVADLVAAEKAVAEVQEEIDAARSWLAEARGRVAMSTVEIGYAPDDAGFWQPLRRSVGNVAGFFGESLGLLVTLVATILPWVLAAGGLIFAVRWLRRRFRRDEAYD